MATGTLYRPVGGRDRNGDPVDNSGAVLASRRRWHGPHHWFGGRACQRVGSTGPRWPPGGRRHPIPGCRSTAMDVPWPGLHAAALPLVDGHRPLQL